jgi:hypothetical protein
MHAHTSVRAHHSVLSARGHWQYADNSRHAPARTHKNAAAASRLTRKCLSTRFRASRRSDSIAPGSSCAVTFQWPGLVRRREPRRLFGTAPSRESAPLRDLWDRGPASKVGGRHLESGPVLPRRSAPGKKNPPAEPRRWHWQARAQRLLGARYLKLKLACRRLEAEAGRQAPGQRERRGRACAAQHGGIICSLVLAMAITGPSDSGPGDAKGAGHSVLRVVNLHLHASERLHERAMRVQCGTSHSDKDMHLKGYEDGSPVRPAAVLFSTTPMRPSTVVDRAC